MAAEVVDRLLPLPVVVRRFLGMGDVPSRTLHSDNYARMKACVCGENSPSALHVLLYDSCVLASVFSSVLSMEVYNRI
jgi:hypothetical protein